ncbi:MAG TPA: hypothetical protein VFL79_04380 [Terriglobia bacterium]|nr:hypothetical protein [Terriglobia bacterium]
MVAPLERSLAGEDGTNALSPSGMLAGVRRLAAAAHVGQIFDMLAEESARMGARAVLFDVRGRAAWGAAASGFDPELPADSLRTLVVRLNQDGPFRQVFETAETVEARPADLESEGQVLAKLKTSPDARILLVPVRSADALVAVLYAETGEKRDLALIDSLKILAAFAGGQIDSMMAANGHVAAVEEVPPKVEAGVGIGQADRDEARAAEPEAAAGPAIPEVASPEPIAAEISEAAPEVEQASTASPETTETPAEAAPLAKVQEATSPIEEEKIHRDARRFSKLLVSEIELYNRTGVAEGRRNRDLYRRLRKDIDRSRETYEKRFAHTVAKRFDYFHDELVKTLAENDATLLGSGYPGPSV